MKNSVVIKGNKYGIVVLLDSELEFDELKLNVAEKFKESPKGFFGKSAMAVSFEGRDLSDDEVKELLNIISENSDLNIALVIDDNQEREEYFKNLLESKGISDKSESKENEQTVKADNNYENSYQQFVAEEALSDYNNDGQFYRGTLRSGQIIESDTSIVILGDVNPGAKVVSAGNVIILGSLKGTVYAGVTGMTGCFVVALEMEPMQIRIGDYIARASDDSNKKLKKHQKPETKIAFVEDGNIYIETLNKEVLNDIHF